MERLVTILLLVISLTWPSFTAAQVSAEDHCLKGCPTGAPVANMVVARSIYALSNNPVTKFSDWVAYKVTAANLSGPTRGRNWATWSALFKWSIVNASACPV
jgi:endonuclease G